MSARIRCTCEFKDLGIAFQLVREDPACAVHHPAPVSMPGQPCAVCGSTQHFGFSCKPDPAPDVRGILDRMRQRCPECHLPGSSHKMDCATGRAEGLAKLREMRATGLLPGYVPALGDAPEPPCDWDPHCTGPEGCPLHGLPRCVGCGEVADHGASCVY